MRRTQVTKHVGDWRVWKRSREDGKEMGRIVGGKGSP